MDPPNGRRTLSATSREPLQCVNVGLVRRGLGQHTGWVAVGRTYRSQRRFRARPLNGSGLCMTQGPPSPAPRPASLSVIQACPTVCQRAEVAAVTPRRMGACDTMGLGTTAVHALPRRASVLRLSSRTVAAARLPSPPPAPAWLWRTCPARLLGCRRWACVGVSWRGVSPSLPCPPSTLTDRRVRASAWQCLGGGPACFEFLFVYFFSFWGPRDLGASHWRLPMFSLAVSPRSPYTNGFASGAPAAVTL